MTNNILTIERALALFMLIILFLVSHCFSMILIILCTAILCLLKQLYYYSTIFNMLKEFIDSITSVLTCTSKFVFI